MSNKSYVVEDVDEVSDAILIGLEGSIEPERTVRSPYLEHDLTRLTRNVAMDVSADLHELTRCPVGLVSSGVKSILDIKRSVLSLPL